MEWSRRAWIGGAGVSLSLLLAGNSGRARGRAEFPFRLSDSQWKERLSPVAYAVLRREATERPWTSPLLKERRRGIYACAGCGQHLFRSQAKYDSRTGWPSFNAAISGAVGTATDFKIGVRRTEVHCSRCGGHLGHVFNDGPPPTGKRWCINGVALKFRGT